MQKRGQMRPRLGYGQSLVFRVHGFSSHIDQLLFETNNLGLGVL